jgi:hypothetical protein
MSIFDDVGWNPVMGTSNFFQEPYGAVLYQTDVKEERLKDAIEKTTKIRISHIAQTSIPNLDSIFLGVRPLRGPPFPTSPIARFCAIALVAKNASFSSVIG